MSALVWLGFTSITGQLAERQNFPKVTSGYNAVITDRLLQTFRGAYCLNLRLTWRRKQFGPLKRVHESTNNSSPYPTTKSSVGTSNHITSSGFRILKFTRLSLVLMRNMGMSVYCLRCTRLYCETLWLKSEKSDAE